MSAPVKKNRVHIFDSNDFITLNTISETVIPLPQGVWDQLDSLLTRGLIISQRYVYEEVVLRSKTPDKVSEWLMSKKEHFLTETPTQVILMAEVVNKFPKLINPDQEKAQADPWLVALARDLSSRNKEVEYVLVTQENTRSTTNLPAACKYFNVPCINLMQFFSEAGIKLELTGI